MSIVADFNSSVTVPFQRMRQLLEDSGRLVEGVAGSTHLAVAQRAAGANMSVDVAAGQAWVEVDTGTRNGLVHVTSDAVTNVTVTASNGTNPRIDQVVLQYNDTSIPTGSGNAPTLAVLAGTATAGATLANRTGAAALGNDRLLLADLLIPAASTSVITANIADRRASATTPGAFHAYRNAAQSPATGAIINFDTEVYDDSNWFDLSIGRFTPLIAGRYRFSWAVRGTTALTANTFWLSQLMKNGAAASLGNTGYQIGTAAAVNSVGSATVIANGTTDFFEVNISHNQGAGTALTTGQANTYFTGELIGRF